MRGWLALVPACALALGLTRSDEEARIEQLREWQETPLDLMRADLTELAMLPGLDPGLAEAVVGLRELGELEAEEDLLQVPGIGRTDLEAIRPYVSLRPPTAASGEWKTLAQRRAEGPGDWRHSLRLGSGSVHVNALARGAPARWWRGAVSAGAGSLELVFGDLSFRSAPGFLDRVAGRSRLGPAPKPRPASVRARTDAGPEEGWFGLALAGPGGLAFAGRAPDGSRVAAGSLSVRADGTLLSTTVRVLGVRAAAGATLVRESRQTMTWCAVALGSRARWMGFGALARGQRWRFGADAAAAEGNFEFGRDPITGYLLDRAHRSLQVHARTRGSSWAAGGIFRSMERGRPVAKSGNDLLEFEFHMRQKGPEARHRLEIRIRVAPVRRVSIAARAPVNGGEWAVRFSHQTDGDRTSEIAGVSFLRQSFPAEWSVTLVGAQGEGSRLWMLRRPGTGIYPVWVRPPGFLAALGGGVLGARVRCGIWTWLRAEAFGVREAGIGLFLAFREGRLVQRLQGAH